MNKRTYSKSSISTYLEQWIQLSMTYVDYTSIKVSDVVLRETSLETLVISKIIESDIEDFTLVDLAGDVFGRISSQESLKESEYVLYKDKLQATRVLFNHNKQYIEQCPIQVVNELYSEYLI